MPSHDTHSLKLYLLRRVRTKSKTQINYTNLIRKYYRASKRGGYIKRNSTKKIKKTL